LAYKCKGFEAQGKALPGGGVWVSGATSRLCCGENSRRNFRVQAGMTWHTLVYEYNTDEQSQNRTRFRFVLILFIFTVYTSSGTRAWLYRAQNCTVP